MQLKNLLISAVLISVFIISLIYIGVNINADYNTNVSILTNPAINNSFTSLNQSLRGSEYQRINSSWTSLQDAPPVVDVVLGALAVYRVIVNIPKLAWNLYNTTILLLDKTLGIPSIFLHSITIILLIVIVMGIVSVIKRGT